ncbi:hypothetical protein K491DRAFT_714429 [Lophiostoma macrostomum CBS 122681]|uniref:Uncharacterized protein n=1 Tax=Lophiostoma macrostomum CBS 122681 TaxID=1314788 RepID=A0A6A6TCL9_9PLEO|nr:hypothetical protein K491DRAFT_714429 [Lophiostoma macrostomum CBS 122681]
MQSTKSVQSPPLLSSPTPLTLLWGSQHSHSVSPTSLSLTNMRLSIVPSIVLSVLLLPTTFAKDIEDIGAEIPGCSYQSNTWHKFVYFAEPFEPSFVFQISTVWDHYAKELSRIIPSEGFILTAPPEKYETGDFCRWKFLFDVHSSSIMRGHVSYQERDVDATGAYRMPSNETLSRVRAVLLDHAPVRDVFLFVLEAAGPTFFLVVILLAAKIYLHRKWTKQEDVELAKSADEEPLAKTLELDSKGVASLQGTSDKRDGGDDVQEYDVDSIRSGDVFSVSMNSLSDFGSETRHTS